MKLFQTKKLNLVIAVLFPVLIFNYCKNFQKDLGNTITENNNPFKGKYNIPADLNLPLIQNVPNFQNIDSLNLFLQNNADDFSWRSFVAICWPSTTHGDPDTSKTFAMESERVVFEHWMPAARIYKKDGQVPDPWDNNLLRSRHNSNEHVLSDLRVIPKLNLFEKTEADHHMLVDQNGNPTYYQIFYNKVAYDYIMATGLYNKAGQKSFVKNWPSATQGLTIIQDSQQVNIAKKFQRAYFSIGNTVDSTFDLNGGRYYFTKHANTSIIKSAWRIITPADDRSRFYIRKVKDDNNNDIEIALVGIHLAQKVSEATQWIWSSFEHNDNAPHCDAVGKPIIDASVKYSYFNKNFLDTNQFNKPQNINSKDLLKLKPDQVVRSTPIASSTQKINDLYHNKIKLVNKNSVWLNYRLIGTQWPFDPTLFTVGGGYTPAKLANTTLESFEQKTSSCMNCHSKARFLVNDTTVARGFGYDADFIWGISNAK